MRLNFLACGKAFITLILNLSNSRWVKSQVGANAFTMSPKKWIKSTNAIGIVSKAGRYGGTYAHSDITFEFASWISPEFKKNYKNSVGLQLRKIYENAKIQTEQNFKEALEHVLSDCEKH